MHVQAQSQDQETSYIMPELRTVLAGLCVLLLHSTISNDKNWKNIIPLHSTRSDVERLLGPSSDECKCTYRLNDATVSVVYSDGDCKSGGTGGWNIRPGTVIRFTVSPKAEVHLSDLAIGLD